jgi:hypothetical protein
MSSGTWLRLVDGASCEDVRRDTGLPGSERSECLKWRIVNLKSILAG